MEFWLPVIFAAVMGLALLLYVILDGYDLGVGLLLPLADESEKDAMVASIGPFWDANETWIVLGVGVLLIAFPAAHGIVLTTLYLPATLMLMGLVLRGVAFDFRIKAGADQKQRWNRLFTLGSLLASLCQGWMLGRFVTGLLPSGLGWSFALLTALALPTLYLMLGACWLYTRTTAALSLKARRWARRLWLPLGLALLVIALATPLVSERIADKWFSFGNLPLVMPVPMLTLAAYSLLGMELWTPGVRRPLRAFLLVTVLCLLSAVGLAYSLYPDIILGQLTLFEAAAAVESLRFALWGVLATVPLILAYTVFVYRIFSGPQTIAHYES
jgi:cytochrome d ubiquinol oxidase subunit II